MSATDVRSQGGAGIRRFLVLFGLSVGIIVGLLAMHSTVGSSSITANTGVSTEAAIGHDGASIDLDGPAGTFDHCETPWDSTLLGACLLAVIIVSVLLLAAFPALHRRLLEQGRRLRPRILFHRLDFYRPSLTALCISRI